MSKNKNNSSSYTKSLRSMRVGERMKFNKSESSNAISAMREMNNEPSAFEFSYTTNSKGQITVTRNVPSNMYNRSLYIDNLSKKEVVNTLRKNNWVKERAAQDLGISARSVGRIIERKNIAVPANI